MLKKTDIARHDEKHRLQTLRRILACGSAAATTLAVPYAAYVAFTWARYGHVAQDHFPPDELLDRFIPHPEVDECHQIHVNAPATKTFEVASALDIQCSPIVRAIFTLRTLPSLLHGSPPADSSSGLLAETLTIGWDVLASVPEREIVIGAVTQPWEPVVTFRPLPADEFVAFNEPGYAKIVWTLAAEPLGPNESLFTTRTRVVTTDQMARERFRRYWALFSPGILVIRYESLRLLKAQAEKAVSLAKTAIPATADA